MKKIYSYMQQTLDNNVNQIYYYLRENIFLRFL